MLEILTFLVIFFLILSGLYYNERAKEKDKMPFNIRKKSNFSHKNDTLLKFNRKTIKKTQIPWKI